MILQKDKRYLTIFALVMLAACGTTDVIKKIDDAYTVSAQYGSLNGSWDRAAKDAMDKAIVFCEERREKIIIINESRDGIYGISPQRVDIVFKCSNDNKSNSTTEELLRSVKSLHEKGLITETQYNDKVKSILNNK